MAGGDGLGLRWKVVVASGSENWVFSDTLRQFAMVFVSIIHDVQFCTVSIHMQGVPLAFDLRQPGPTCLQAGAQDGLDHLGQNAFQQAP